jgi:hypothetical protein
VGRLYEKLADRFGQENVFKDVDSIDLGADFRSAITNAIESCDVVLVMIGSMWVSVADNDGNRRLNNPDDYVRIEIETAFAREIETIPVLVGETRIPARDELPETIEELRFLNAAKLRPDPDFVVNEQRISAAVAKHVNAPNESNRRDQMLDEVIEELDFATEASELDGFLRFKMYGMWVLGGVFGGAAVVLHVLAVMLGRTSPFTGGFGMVMLGFAVLYLLGFFVQTTMLLRYKYGTNPVKKSVAKLERRLRKLLENNAPDSQVSELLHDVQTLGE